QQPHPPVWMAAGSPSAIEWAAASGYAILMDPHATHTELGQKRKFYQDKLEEHGYSIAGRETPMARLLAIAPTDAKAKEIAYQGARWMLRTYVNPAMFNVADPLQRYVDEVIIHGTPERVADEITRLREEIHLDYLIGAPLSHETFLLFTDKVLAKMRG
ncbi:MAG: LLM class flavin-dependent oxidoreductase, partial [Candidatus Binatia bacterium]